MKKIKELLLKYKEVIMYLIFGVATTLVNWIVYSLLMKTSVVNMTVSNAIAWFTATGVIEIGGLPLLYYIGVKQSLFGGEGFLAKILVSIIVVILNYVFSKIFVFNKKDK